MSVEKSDAYYNEDICSKYLKKNIFQPSIEVYVVVIANAFINLASSKTYEF